MDHRYRRPSFFKLYFASSKVIPPSRLYLFYEGRPLYCPATFRTDRYSFELPRNLEEKMLAGELIADFSYEELSGRLLTGRKSPPVPGCIVLRDRYE
jgi:hypothetical protein